MTSRELEIAKLQADLTDQGRAAAEPATAQIIAFVARPKPAKPVATRAQTEADYWAQRHQNGDDCA